MRGHKDLYSVRLSIGFLTLLLQFIFMTGALYPQGWQIHTIDNFYSAYTTTRETRLIRIGLDSNGTPHIIYYKDIKGTSRNKLAHAMLENGVWQKEIIDEMWARVGVAPIANSMVIDATNQISVIYQNVYESQRNLKIARGTFGAWSLDFVDPVSFPNKAGDWNASALDLYGNLHVAYWRYINHNEYLYYGKYDGKSWQKELVRASSGEHVSIDVDKFGFPHIVCNDIGTYRSSLIYIHYDGERWQVQNIAQQQYPGKYRTYPSIKLDRNGNPNIAYHDTDDGKLKLARYDGQRWITEIVDGGPSNRVGQWASLALDRRGRPVIAYYGESNGSLKLARKIENQWQIETIDNSGDVGQYADLSLNQCDDPYIAYAYRDRYGNSVKVAYPAPYGPQAFSLIKPANGAYVKNRIEFQWDPSSFLGQGLQNYQIWIDGSLSVDNIAPSKCNYLFTGNLNDGVHTWRVRAVLSNGGEVWSNETWSFILDSSPPRSFALMSPENNSWVSTSKPTFKWQASADQVSGLAKYQLTIDGQLAADDIDPSRTSAVPIFPLADGAHSWKITAFDLAGNSRDSDQTWTLNVDQTPPEAFTLISPINGTWHGTSPLRFSWNQTKDNGIGLLKYAFLLDNSTLIDSISVDSTSVTLDPAKISEGLHTWRVLAYDQLKNVQQSPEWTIKFDKSSPEAFSLIGPADSSVLAIPTPEFSWQATTDLKSGLSHYQLWIDNKLDRDNITANKSAPSSPLGEGIHEWYVVAIDNVGNARKSKQTFHVIWDKTPPAAFDLLSPADGDTVESGTPQFSWNPSSDVGSGLRHYELWINGILNKTVPPTTTSTIPSTPLQLGEYNWFVKAIDFGGNATPSKSIRKLVVYKDQIAPVSTIVSPRNGEVIGGNLFTISGTASDEGGSGLKLVEVDIDNTGWRSAQPINGSFRSWRYDWQGFDEGTHTIRSRATDNADNIETPKEGINVIVARTAPKIVSVKITPNPAKAGQIHLVIQLDPGVGEIDNTYRPNVSFIPSNDTTRYEFQQTRFEGNIWEGIAQIDSAMPNGSATIQVSGFRNSLGNEMPLVKNAGQFVIDTISPFILSADVNPDTTGIGTVSIRIKFADETSGLNFSIDPTVFVQTPSKSTVNVQKSLFDASTGIWEGTANINADAGDGMAIIGVSGAQDIAGNVMQEIRNASSFLIDVTPPSPFSLVSPQDSLWTTKKQPLLEWSPASDATTGLDHYELYLNNNVNVSFVSPDVTSVRPATPLRDAAYFWYIIAVDRTGNRRKSTETSLFQIDTTPPTTTITSPSAGDTLDQTVTIQGTATDSSGIGVDSVWVSTDGGNTWHAASKTADDFSRWKYLWTFKESGVRVLKSRARDKLGNLETPGTGVLVQLRNYAPQISSIPDTSVLEDSRFVYQVLATDPNPMDSLRFWDNTDLFDIDSVSGLIDFVPDNAAVGVHTISIYATDGQLVDSTQFRLTIVNVNDPPLPFQLLAPPNAAQINTLNPVLSWEPSVDIDVGDTVRYEIILSANSDFSDTLIAAETKKTSYRISEGLERNKEYFWYVIAQDLWGEKVECETRFMFRTSGIATDIDGRITDQIPTRFELSQNYPNPFNPETRIRFAIPKQEHVLIEIYNAIGQKVRKMVDSKLQAGFYEKIWDGRNSNEERVPSGIYLLHMRAGQFMQTRKMVVVQ